jgi:N-acetylneuraminate synthase
MGLKKEIVIDGKRIGDNSTPYIIGEISGNHGGSLERARQLVKAAAKAGVSAVKLQTYTADTMTLDSDRAEFLISDPKSLWYGRRLHGLYKEAMTPWEWHSELFALAKEEGVTAFSTPFDTTAVDFLEELNVPCYKISSFECTDLRLVKYVAQTRKPVILSIGTASLSEVAKSVETLKAHGCSELALLACVSLYPAPPEAFRLEKIALLKKMFGVPCGLSDHSIGITIPIAAIGAGANVIEKHFNLDDNATTIDGEFSLTASQLAIMCKETRYAAQAMGGSTGWAVPDESARHYRRSLYFTRDIRKGEVIGKNDIKSVRPGLGLETVHHDQVVGMIASQDISFATPVAWGLLSSKS